MIEVKTDSAPGQHPLSGGFDDKRPVAGLRLRQPLIRKAMRGTAKRSTIAPP